MEKQQKHTEDKDKYTVCTPAEEIIRQNNREAIMYWIRHAIYLVLYGVVATAYWWVWILLGIIIEHT